MDPSVSPSEGHKVATPRNIRIAVLVISAAVAIIFAVDLWRRLSWIQWTGAANMALGDRTIATMMPLWELRQQTLAWQTFVKRETAVAVAVVGSLLLVGRLYILDLGAVLQRLKTLIAAAVGVLILAVVAFLIFGWVVYRRSPEYQALNVAQASAAEFFGAPLDDDNPASWIVESPNNHTPATWMVCYCDPKTRVGWWWGVDLEKRQALFVNPPKGDDLRKVRSILQGHD